MITKKPKPIKLFKTLDEEAMFWDTHDTSVIFKNPKTLVSKLPKLKINESKNQKFAF